MAANDEAAEGFFARLNCLTIGDAKSPKLRQLSLATAEIGG